MLTKLFLIKQGNCCGHGCIQCPYYPKHSGNSNKINLEIFNELEDWEMEELQKLDKKKLIFSTKSEK